MTGDALQIACCAAVDLPDEEGLYARNWRIGIRRSEHADPDEVGVLIRVA